MRVCNLIIAIKGEGHEGKHSLKTFVGGMADCHARYGMDGSNDRI